MLPRVVVCCRPDVPVWRAQINLPMHVLNATDAGSAPDRSDRSADAGHWRNHGSLAQPKPAPVAISRSDASMTTVFRLPRESGRRVGQLDRLEPGTLDDIQIYPAPPVDQQLLHGPLSTQRENPPSVAAAF